ncbi:hypothetical protein GCM10025868_42840 [Angustibacter aerolatus]|uniref:Cobaltochelatase subunit CobN n=1 Tax=Angustibacter aerolatus TaxID=1162965 RepID=A0ABQ6JNX4_9ACTN|nr:hypothetical protein [Angustibacter aerolatus]GMA89034.1 hypothetical protein GCM10025868_42840 [Angustibacter aerolatus]
MPRLLLLSTSDTDLLAAHRTGRWRVGNPARVDASEVPAVLGGADPADLVVVRLLGGRQAWPEGLDAVLASGLPTVVVSGENAADAALQALSTVPAGVVTQALAYLVEGGVDNLREPGGVPGRHGAARRRGLRTAARHAAARGARVAAVPRAGRRGAAGRRRLLPGARA